MNRDSVHTDASQKSMDHGVIQSPSLRLGGSTKLLCMIGHPIAQVRAPELVTNEFNRRGINAVLVPCDVQPRDFATVLPSLMRIENLAGFLITVPHKPRVVEFADSLGPHASHAGVASALVRLADGRWRGEAFDGIGCIEAFRHRSVDLVNKRVMLLGCGGAGSSMAIALAKEKPAEIYLVDPIIERAEALMQAVLSTNASVKLMSHNRPIQLSDIDILINASTIGMRDPSHMPIEVDCFPKNIVVFDAVAKEGGTKLLNLARANGCVAIDGVDMMHGQNGKIVDFMVDGWAEARHS
ncbi:hypothetical protein [Nitratireductor sp. StC3]|uniref:shikimate dehydrogenase family protein n=1 Tax=Nitratireductor sp. StC3 TaxID=2126741 RepID=UPI000D0D7C52|nr:hypothetical protein [Nitratireductor sp. StC3]PSM16805.1 hypothetical protein C7T96_19240 [Nitratireductor sp. StC3]